MSEETLRIRRRQRIEENPNPVVHEDLRMNITIHRGTHQIGGCVTEYESNGWHLFVDYGEELAGGPKSGTLKVEGLTHGDFPRALCL